VKIKRISHVAVAVPDVDEAFRKFHEVLGVAMEEREVVASQQVEAAMMPLGEAAIELIAPAGNEGVARFLEKRGPGLHHIALRVPDLAAAVAALTATGARLLNQPRIGAGGHTYVFVHPASTGGVLLELIQEHTS